MLKVLNQNPQSTPPDSNCSMLKKDEPLDNQMNDSQDSNSNIEVEV